MGTLKKVGIGLVAIIALALIAAAFMPTHFESEMSKDMNASKENIHNVVNDLKKWNEWGPWMEQDPDMKITYGEKTEGLGASYAWESKMGNGSMEITEVDAPNMNKYKMQFEGMGESDVWMKVDDAEGDANKLTWGTAFDVPWPVNLMMAFDSGEDMKNMYETGLTNIKNMAEKMEAEKPNYEVSTVEMQGMNYVAIRHNGMNVENLTAEFFGNNFGLLMAALGAANLEPAGSPSALYYTWDEENKTSDMAVAIPVASDAKVSADGVEMVAMPAGQAYVINHYGPYENTGNAHIAMDAYLKANNLTPGGPVVEEYLTDPGTEPDQSKWLTRVIYPAGSQVAEK